MPIIFGKTRRQRLNAKNICQLLFESRRIFAKRTWQMEIREKSVILRDVARNVRRLRKAQKLSQHKLSVLSDVTRTNIGYIENAKHDVRVGTLCAVATALGVNLVALFDHDDVEIS